MNSILGIIKRNNSTFYDNRSDRRVSVFPRILLLVALGLLLSWVLGTPSDEVVSSVITVQSILVGFGFSVLFFLVSSAKEDPSVSASIENKLRKERLNKLSDELFFNISYYNVTTFFSLLLALLFAFDIAPMKQISLVFINNFSFFETIKGNLETFVKYLHHTLIAILYFILLESIFTFYRIVVRVNFYFDQKRKLTSTEV